MISIVEGRIRWYETAIEYRKRGVIPPIGFPIPDGDIETWEVVLKELKDILSFYYDTKKNIKPCPHGIASSWTSKKENLNNPSIQ